MRCPYCLELTKPTLEKKDNRLVYVCSNPNCKMEIARDFVEKPKVPLATVGMVGFPGHGKTVYVTSLFLECLIAHHGYNSVESPA